MMSEATATAIQLNTLLTRVEQSGPPANPGDYEVALKQHTELDELLDALENELEAYRTRVSCLPKLPPHHIVEWSQAVLQMQLAILVLETTGVNRDADILRVTVRNAQGSLIYDSLVRPSRYQTSNAPYTGLTLEQVMNAPSFDVIYDELLEALKGRYIVAYGLEFVLNILRNNIGYYRLPAFPPSIRTCLQEKTQAYFHASWSLKLTDACSRIGYELAFPAPSDKRAEAQLRLLSAMALGITAHPAEDGEEDEHPF